MTQKYDNWCRDLSVLGNVDGKDYCLFHAPKGWKGILVEKFNNSVYQEIERQKEANNFCNLSGTIFEGDISFSHYGKDNPLPDINFLDSQFNGKADFNEAQFGGAFFTETIFSREAIFTGAQFSKEAFFTGTIFSENAILSKVKFNSDVDFINAKFNGDAGFEETKFGSMVKFAGVKFSREANFFKDQFSGTADFFGAQFSKEAFFTETQFNGMAHFNGVQFNEKAFFIGAKFVGNAVFTGAQFTKETIFWEETFLAIGDFRLITIKEKLRLQNVNLQSVSLLDTDVRMIDFFNCKFPQKNKRDVLYDEVELFEYKKNKDFKNNIKSIELLYRRLKQKYKEEHNEPEVSNWHYGEKEMFRKKNRFRRFFPLSLSNLYWLSSGYGERSVRSGIVLVSLIIVISILFGLTGIKPVDNGSIVQIKEWTDIWNLDYLKATLDYVKFESKPDFISTSWFLKITAKLLIPLQLSLFVLAVRNRFRR